MKKTYLFIVCSLYILQAAGQYRMATEPEPSGIRVFTTADEAFTLWLDGFVHLEGGVFFGYYEDYDPIPNGGVVRNARLALKTAFADGWSALFEADFSKLKPRITQAFIQYSGIHNLYIKAGHFESLFSMEGALLPREQAFLEKPMVITAMVPVDLLGIQFSTNQYWFMGSLGISFDKALYPRQNPKADSILTASFDSRSVMAKAVAMPFVNRKDLGLHLGAGASYKFPVKDPVTGSYPAIRYRLGNVSYINRHQYLDTYVINNIRSQFLLKGEGGFYYKGLRIQGEYIHNMTNLGKPLTGVDGPVSVLNFKGFYVQSGFLLFGGRQRYDTTTGLFMNPSRGRKWGDVELLARYDYLDLNYDPIKGGASQNYTAGITYYINDHVKLMANYIYTDNDRYANGAGQFLIGHDAYGYPSADYSQIIETIREAGVDFHTISLRFEVTF
ncbi:MAG TPA: hypothetical protein DDW70_06740 [Rikenellaceae bacterium]|nr:hypothetical protein [Rikenellaceae bacterium]